MSERFDAIVVGAGPAGTAAALTMARGGLNVIVIERGEFPGAKNVFGGVLYRHHFEELIPEWWTRAPLERPIVEQNYWLLNGDGAVKIGHRSRRYLDGKPNNFTAMRAKFDRWFAQQAEEAGALIICETTATELLMEGDRVIGVRTDRDEGDVYAEAVIIADGANSLLTQQLRARPELSPGELSLVVKQTLALPREKIEDRFGLEKDEGATIEILGAPSQGMVGLGFLYTNKDSLSLGLGIMVDDLMATGARPYELLEAMKQHPALRKLLQGAELKEYAAHLIPEGGLRAMPKLAGPGWMICGDAAGMVNAVHREGTNLAAASGRMAGEAVVTMARSGDFTPEGFQAYARAVQASFIQRDLAKYQRLPAFLHEHKELLMGRMPEALNDCLYEWFNVDERPKTEHQRQIAQNIKGMAGGAWGLLRLASRGWRAINE